MSCKDCNEELDELDNGLESDDRCIKCLTKFLNNKVRQSQIDDLVDLWREAENELSERFGDYQKSLQLKADFTAKLEELNLNEAEMIQLNEEIQNEGG
mgnify:CR=1 FL=1